MRMLLYLLLIGMFLSASAITMAGLASAAPPSQGPGPGGNPPPTPPPPPPPPPSGNFVQNITQNITDIIQFPFATLVQALQNAIQSILQSAMQPIQDAFTSVLSLWLENPGIVNSGNAVIPGWTLMSQAWRFMNNVAIALWPLTLAIVAAIAAKDAVAAASWGIGDLKQALSGWLIAVIASATSLWWMDLANQFTNAVTGYVLFNFGAAFDFHPLTALFGAVVVGLLGAMPLIGIILVIFIVLLGMAVFVALTFSIIARLVVMYLLVAVAPVAIILGVLPPTRFISYTWLRGLIFILGLGPVNALLLKFAFNLAQAGLSAPPLTALAYLIGVFGVISILLTINGALIKGVFGAVIAIAQKTLSIATTLGQMAVAGGLLLVGGSAAAGAGGAALGSGGGVDGGGSGGAAMAGGGSSPFSGTGLSMAGNFLTSSGGSLRGLGALMRSLGTNTQPQQRQSTGTGGASAARAIREGSAHRAAPSTQGERSDHSQHAGEQARQVEDSGDRNAESQENRSDERSGVRESGSASGLLAGVSSRAGGSNSAPALPDAAGGASSSAPIPARRPGLEAIGETRTQMTGGFEDHFGRRTGSGSGGVDPEAARALSALPEGSNMAREQATNLIGRYGDRSQQLGAALALESAMRVANEQSGVPWNRMGQAMQSNLGPVREAASGGIALQDMARQMSPLSNTNDVSGYLAWQIGGGNQSFRMPAQEVPYLSAPGPFEFEAGKHIEQQMGGTIGSQDAARLFYTVRNPEIVGGGWSKGQALMVEAQRISASGAADPLAELDGWMQGNAPQGARTLWRRHLLVKPINRGKE